MLTPEALNERKRGQFPELRKILGRQGIPNDYYGPTSVSSNILPGCRISLRWRSFFE